MIGLQESAKRYFEIYPEQEKMYATEDGNFFLRVHDAKNHAIRSNQKMYEFTKDEQAAKPASDTQVDVTRELKEQLLGLNIIETDYHLLVKILNGLNKAPESKKKEHVIEAATNLQNELKAFAQVADVEAKSEEEESSATE